ncbi:MAG: TPM domain-containing protein [Arenimonas sp.]
MKRLLLNLFRGWFQMSRWFPASTLTRIRDLITEGERHHAGEICFAVEARYSIWSVLNGLQSRARANYVFSTLHVWDTQDNSGVLLYLQLAERRVELVADRGIAARVDRAQRQSICEELTRDIANGPADIAVIECIEKINALLIIHFPASEDNPHELSNDPVIL